MRPRSGERGLLACGWNRGRTSVALCISRDPRLGREARELSSGRGLARRRVHVAGGSQSGGPGSRAASFPRDSPRSGGGISPGDRIPAHDHGRRGRTVPHAEPWLVGRGGPADLRIFRPDHRGTPRIRPGRIAGPAPSGHRGAGSPPHGSRRAVGSEGECLAMFDPRDPGPDGSPRDRVPGWLQNRIEA